MPLTFFSFKPVILVLGLYLILLYILQFTFLSSFDGLFSKPTVFPSTLHDHASLTPPQGQRPLPTVFLVYIARLAIR